MLCGDWNTPGDGTQIDNKIAQLLSDYNLTQRVTEPTHESGHVLDVVVTGEDDVQQVSDVGVYDVCFSDHRLVTYRLQQLSAGRQDVVTHTYRNIKKVDMPAFRSDLIQSPAIASLASDSPITVDDFVSVLHSELTRLIDRHAPVHTKTRRVGRHEGLSLSQEARQAKRVRRRMERRYRRTGSDADRRAYKAANKAASASIMRSRADMIYHQLFLNAGDQRALWQTAQRLLHSRPSIYYSDEECSSLVDTFGGFFNDKLNRINDTIAATLDSVPSTEPITRSHDGPSLTEFRHVTSLDVHRIITKMKPKTSPLDIIPVSIIKDCVDLFAPVIARLANLTFAEGRFPSDYKTAQVMPLLKKQGLDKKAPENYRPISNLTTISKILERLALAQLRPHLLDSPNYSPLQSAYRAGHSTETALLSVLNDVYTAGDSKRSTVVLGLDMSAAFDTISHRVLLDRLQSDFGITGVALSWIESYLSGRGQFVKIGRFSSPVTPCTSGVPQGSVLGPLLFTSYISPISDVIAQYDVSHHLFADDLQLYLSMKALESALRLLILTDCANAVRRWFLENGLLVNPDKTDGTFFGTEYQLRSAAKSLPVFGAELPMSRCIKSLGVVLDSRLTFSDHVTSVVKSCNYHISALRHVRSMITHEAAQTLACSLINSRLDYCNSLLYGAPTSTLDRLQRVQNSAARVVKSVGSGTHALPLLESLHWLPVRQRVEFKLALLVYKTGSTGTPSYLQRLLTPRQAVRELRSSSRPLYSVPSSVRTSFGRRAFSFAGPSIWNRLPEEVTSSQTVSTFKRRLKTHHFKLTFVV